MGVFEQFPYTNFHDLNLDWIVQELEKLATDVQNFISINASWCIITFVNTKPTPTITSINNFNLSRVWKQKCNI